MILAIDPGLTTGWAGWNLPTDTGFASGMVEGRFAFYEWFYELLTAYYAKGAPSYSAAKAWAGVESAAISMPFTVVMEQFTVTQATARKSPQPDPYLIIGHVEAICHRDNILFETQLPSAAMTFATNDKLKAFGWYRPGKGHDNDAARHLLLYMTKTHQLPWDLRARLGELIGVSPERMLQWTP